MSRLGLVKASDNVTIGHGERLVDEPSKVMVEVLYMVAMWHLKRVRKVMDLGEG